jgi:hypothetical protein
VEADLPECLFSQLNLDTVTKVHLSDLSRESRDVFACSKLDFGDFMALEHERDSLETTQRKRIVQRTHQSLVDGEDTHGVEGSFSRCI